MGRNDLCFCESQKKQKKCHPNIHEKSFFADLIKLYQAVDKAITNQSHHLGCQKGCSECCFQNFGISSAEYHFIMNYIYETQGAEAVLRYIEKGNQMWLEFKETNPENAEKLIQNIEGALTEDKVNHLLENLGTEPHYNGFPCVFLNTETQSCGVYDVRPYICREFGVGYSTKKEISNERDVFCSKTSEGVPLSDLVDLTKLTDDIFNISLYESQRLNIRAIGRTYPMFYFCKITHENPDALLMKIQEYRDYSKEQCTEMHYERLKGRTKP